MVTGCATATNTGGTDNNNEPPDASVPGQADAAVVGQADGAPERADAAPKTIDAGLVQADAMVAPADAGLPSADAGCTEQTLSVLSNANFDQGSANWGELSGGGFQIITLDSEIPGVTAESGSHLAWLGGYSLGTTAQDILYQDVAVPAGATAMSFRGKIWIDTQENTGLAWDTLKVELVTTSGIVLKSLGSWSNLNTTTSWTDISVDATGSYSGQTIRLRWTADLDATKSTSFLVDSLVLDATTCL